MKKKLLIIISMLSIIIVFRIIRDVDAIEIMQSHEAETISIQEISDEITIKEDAFERPLCAHLCSFYIKLH